MKMHNNASPPTLTEKQFSGQVEDLFKLFGWKFSHTYEQAQYARRSTKGFPDYVAVKGERCLFIEIKSENGKLTPPQEEWANLLAACPGVEYYCFRPSNLLEIMKILR